MSTVFLCRASGEGSHNFKVCASLEEVVTFYGSMFGEDTTGDLMGYLCDEDRWCMAVAYHEDLYCAKFDCWKVEPSELAFALPEENATKTCVGCGSSWTAPVSYCPQCGPTAKDRIAAVKADQAGEPISAKDAAYALCRAIEALPGSPQQTALSIKASELLLSLGNSSPHSHGSQRAMVMSPDGLRVVDNVSLPSPQKE